MATRFLWKKATYVHDELILLELGSSNTHTHTHTHTKYNTWHACHILAIKQIIEDKPNLLFSILLSSYHTLWEHLLPEESEEL